MSEWQEVYLKDVYDIGSGLSKPAEDFGLSGAEKSEKRC